MFMQTKDGDFDGKIVCRGGRGLDKFGSGPTGLLNSGV